MSDSETTKVVYVGAQPTHVPDVGDFEPGEVKDIDNELVEWLTVSGESTFFKVHVPVEDQEVETTDEYDLTVEETGK